MGGDPHSPEWTVMWTLTRALRSWIKLKDKHRPAVIADQVVRDHRQSHWHDQRTLQQRVGFDPMASKPRRDRQHGFDDDMNALNDLRWMPTNGVRR